jgi:hypothetical protein
MTDVELPPDGRPVDDVPPPAERPAEDTPLDPVVEEYLSENEFQLLLEAQLSAVRGEYAALVQKDAEHMEQRRQELEAEIARLENLLGIGSATP